MQRVRDGPDFRRSLPVQLTGLDVERTSRLNPARRPHYRGATLGVQLKTGRRDIWAYLTWSPGMVMRLDVFGL